MNDLHHPGRIASRQRARLDYRCVWRWHFYASFIAIPFVMWLSATGAVYLFQPQIDAWLDRPYEHLTLTGPRATAAAQAAAALAAVPGSTLNSYQLPLSPQSAVQILVGRGPELYRAYVHPASLQVLKVVRDDSRPTRVLFYLHGELLAGTPGSMLVELAASWGVVMILTGLFLWWPRKHRGLGGVVYPRLGRKNRVFWRDLHAVTAVWVAFFALFLVMSGLPWAKSWGGVLKLGRQIGGETMARLDWTTGRTSELEERVEMNTPPDAVSEHAGHGVSASSAGRDYSPVDRIVTTIVPLGLVDPVLISPPSKADRQWSAQSKAENRISRTRLEFDGATGAVLSREDFSQGPLIDRMVGIGVAVHVGQLFGIVNQLLGLFAAIGLEVVCVSAVVLWWKRRPAAMLGALPALERSRVPAVVFALIAVLGLVFPLLGASLICVLVLERTVFRRVPAICDFLGLSSVAS